MLSIERSLAESENLNVKHELMELTKEPIYMSEDRYNILSVAMCVYNS